LADYGSAAGLVRHGLGIAFIPASAAGELAGLPVLEVAGEGTAAKHTEIEGTDVADAATGGG
jgi:hypothetical protein